MNSTMTAMAITLAATALAAAPAQAQSTYGAQPSQQPPEAQAQAQAAAQASAPANPNAIRTHQPKLSREASKPIMALQNAVNAKDQAAIAETLPAAQAAAKTAGDRYAISILQLKAAGAAKDNAAIAAALEAMLASGEVKDDEKFGIYINMGQTYTASNQAARASQAYQQALQLNPNSADATAGLAEAKYAAGQAAEAVALLRKGIALQTASGARPEESWYKRAVALAYKAKLPQAMEISRDWVAAYPTKTNWSDALAIHQNLVQLDEARNLDLLRLKRATGTLVAGDYFTYGDIAVRKGLAGEAKAVLEQGFAANTIKRSDPSFSQLYTLASQRTKGDRESLPAAAVAGANARQTMNVGDAWLGYGDYAKAAAFYRSALGRPEADPNLINLHLGIALALQGDKAGATTALKAAGGDQAELAKYWLLYVNTRS